MNNKLKINELRYHAPDFNKLGEDDAILIYKGNIYPLYLNDYSNYNILQITEIIKVVTEDFYDLKNVFFDDNGELKQNFLHRKDLFFDVVKSLEEYPKILFGYVENIDDSYAISFEYSLYDIPNSNEFKQFLQTPISKFFKFIVLNGIKYDTDVLRNGGYENKNKNNSNIAPKLYHGTTTKYLASIMDNGLQRKMEKSIFGIETGNYVFLTSILESAYGYASMYSGKIGGEPCVIEIDSEKLNKNNIVLDFDISNMYTDDYENSPFKDTLEKNKIYHKSAVINNKDDNGTKFGKIGYKGVVSPFAINGVYLDDKRFYTRDKIIGILDREKGNKEVSESIEGDTKKKTIYYGVFLNSESKDKLKELLPENYSKVFCDHMTIVFKTQFDDNIVAYCESRINQEVHLTATEIGESDDVIAVKVETDIQSKNKIKHITICTLKNTSKPSQSNDITQWKKLETPIPLQGKINSFPFRNDETSINEMKSKDVDLSSFKVKEKLNPKFWDGENLKPEIRKQMLKIANDYLKELTISWVKPDDITLTGSIANYNWSKYSDIDIHILMDYEKVWNKEDFVEDYFSSKKELWGINHDELKMFGYDVELYVENTSKQNGCSGVYSLKDDKWVTPPNNFQDAKMNNDLIKEKSAYYITEIDKINKRWKREKDKTKLKKMSRKLNSIFKKLKRMRREAIQKQGELGTYNIIWKVLRRSGRLPMIFDIQNSIFDKINSLK